MSDRVSVHDYINSIALHVELAEVNRVVGRYIICLRYLTGSLQ